MELWIKNEVSQNAIHYVGSMDFNENFTAITGNPGDFTYNVLANNPGTSWVKYYGYWNGYGTLAAFPNGTANWPRGTKYFSPLALLNYAAPNSSSYISGWKIIKVSHTGNRYFDGYVGIDTAPSTYLHVKEAVNTGNEGFYLTNWNGTTTVKIGSDGVAGGGKLSLNNNSGTNNIFLSSYGNSYISGSLGIGTSTPSAKLHVSGAATSTQIVVGGGSANWNEILPGTSSGTMHLNPGTGSDNFGNAITFGASDDGYSNNAAQAGIYIRSDGSYGTKMYLATTDAYISGAKTRLFIDFNGRVGIGTTTPKDLLDVFGSLILRDTYNLSWGNTYGPGVPTITGTSGSNSFIAFYPAGTSGEKVRIDNNGDIGVSVTDPIARLDINVGVAKTDTTTFGYPSLILRSNEASNYSNLGINFIGGATQANRGFQFQTGEQAIANAGNILFQPYGGNVGVGLLSPSVKLHVSGTTGGVFEVDGASAVNALYVSASGNVGIGTTTPTTGKLQINTGTANNNALTIQADTVSARTYGIGITSTAGLDFYDNTAAASRLFISSSGNIGIGNTTPVAKLDLSNGGSIRLQNLQQIEWGGSTVAIDGSNSANHLRFWTNNTVRMTISGSNIGIGTANPTLATLQIVGNVSASSYTGSLVGALTGTASWASNAITAITASQLNGYANQIVYTILTPPTNINGPVIKVRYDGSTVDRYIDIGAIDGNGLYNEGLKLTNNSTITWLGNNVWHAGNLTNLNQLTNGPGYITSTIASTSPTLILKDTDNLGTGVGQTGFISYQDSGNTERGFVGFGSVSSNNFTINNSKGDIVLTPTNNVGIGNTSPTYKLHVSGTNNTTPFGISIGSTAAYLFKGNSTSLYTGTFNINDTGLYIGHDSSVRSLNLQTNNTDRLTILGDGSVGIGTTSPTYKLDVAGAISMHDEAQDLDSRYYNGTFLRGWTSFDAGNESSITYTTDTTSPVGAEVLSVSTYVWARGPKIRLDRTQNYEVEFWVKRQTAGTAGTFYMMVSNYGSNGATIFDGGSDWYYPAAASQTTLVTGTWYKYRFIVGPYGGGKDHSTSARYISIGFIANYTTGTDTMYFTGFKCRPIPRYNNDALTIYNNGNVGIGTTNLSGDFKLRVSSSTQDRHFLAVGVAPSINFMDPSLSTHIGTVGIATATDNFFTGTSGGELCIMSRGTTANSILFGINSTTINASISTAGTFTARADVVAYGTPSDISFKTNILPLQNSLDKIIQLEPVSFTWKEETESNKLTGIKDDLGFIAQQVQEILPELVRENDNGTLSLRERGIIPLLVGAIKEQQKQIDELKYLLQNKI
jgi:hypothetical protein